MEKSPLCIVKTHMTVVKVIIRLENTKLSYIKNVNLILLHGILIEVTK